MAKTMMYVNEQELAEQLVEPARADGIKHF
jgi:hypothetical protein